MRQNTPIGVNLMIIIMIFMMTSSMQLMSSPTFWPFSPAARTPAPRKMAIDDDRQHVGRNHRLKQVGREDVHDDLHDGGSFLRLIFQRAQICGRQRGKAALEEVDEHKTDDDGQQRLCTYSTQTS